MAEFLSSHDWISWYKNISNREVLEIIKRCHIGFLPTYEDTYGFCVLEMQACGVPVVTTNSNALSEFNNDDCGWIIDMDGYLDTWIIDFWNEEHNISNRVCNHLRRILKAIFKSAPGDLEKKAMNSIMLIKKNHDIDNYRRKKKNLIF